MCVCGGCSSLRGHRLPSGYGTSLAALMIYSLQMARLELFLEIVYGNVRLLVRFFVGIYVNSDRRTRVHLLRRLEQSALQRGQATLE